MSTTTQHTSRALMTIAHNQLSEHLKVPPTSPNARERQSEACYHEDRTLYLPGTTKRQRHHGDEWWAIVGWIVLFAVGGLILGGLKVTGALSDDMGFWALLAVPTGLITYITGCTASVKHVFHVDDHDLRHAWEVISRAVYKTQNAADGHGNALASAMIDTLTQVQEEARSTIFDLTRLRNGRKGATYGVLGAPEEVLQARWAARDSRGNTLHDTLHRQAALALAAAWALDADMDVVQDTPTPPAQTSAADRLEALLTSLA